MVNWSSIRLFMSCYTKWELNYVFSLSRDSFLDATEFGNSARFINSTDTRPNCAANFRQVSLSCQSF